LNYCVNGQSATEIAGEKNSSREHSTAVHEF
jgi:hypothetical protein